MDTKNELQAKEKQELQSNNAERMNDRYVYVPRADIYESEDAIHVIANMAGVDENDVDVTLEKNVLTIKAETSAQKPEGMELSYQEYAVGNYERSFIISEEIDRDGIVATVKDGVLDLTLPKSKKALARKIPIKAA